MNFVKGTLGLFIAVALPIALALVFTGLGLGYDHQHVNDLTLISSVTPAGGGEIDRYAPHSFYHSTGEIVAVSGAIALGWVVVSALCIWLGLTMFVKRNVRWD